MHIISFCLGKPLQVPFLNYLFSDDAIQLNETGTHRNFASAAPKFYLRTTAGVKCSSQNRRFVSKVVKPTERYDPVTMLPIIETGMYAHIYVCLCIICIFDNLY